MHEFFSLSKIMDVDGSNSSPTASIAHHRDLFPYEANCLVKTVDPNLICIKVDKRDIIRHVGNIPLNNKYVCWESTIWGIIVDDMKKNLFSDGQISVHPI